MRSTLYEVLGVSEEASREEIAVAYQVRHDALHAASGPDSQADLKLLQEAHAILSDPVERMKYDQRLKAEAARNNRAVYYEEASGGSGWLVKAFLLVALAAGGYFAYSHYVHGKAQAPADGAAASAEPQVDPVEKAADAKATILGDEDQAFAGVARRSAAPPPPPAPAPAPAININDIDAVPLPVPATQRVAYQSFLAHSPPRAFVICNDGTVTTIFGGQGYVEKQLAALRGTCTPYAVNDDVVWNKGAQ